MRISDWSSDVCSSDLLDEIEAYNRIDCISSAELRDWLVSIRPTAPWPELAPDASDKEVEEDADTQALRATLKESGLPQDRQDMLFNLRSEEHTSELQSLMRISYAVFRLNKNNSNDKS